MIAWDGTGKLRDSMLNNTEIAHILRHIADILSIQGENPFKIRAYLKAAETIGGLTQTLTSLEDKRQLDRLPGIGAGIAKKVSELLTTGRLSYYERLKQSEYGALTELLQIPGVGPKLAKLVHDQLGVASLADLQAAAEAGRLKALHGMGPKKEQQILQGLEQVQKYKERHALAVVYPRAEAILTALQGLPAVEKITLAGSIRRMRATVADVDILVASQQPEQIMAPFVSLPQAERVLAHGSTKSGILTTDGIQVDLRVVPAASFGAALHYFTGSKAHNIRIRSLGLEKGLKVNEYGVFKKQQIVAGATEEALFSAVGLPYIPPELREDQGEIETALAHRLPSLIADQDIKGDLHVHTNWSDGRNSLAQMVEAAIVRGYAYMAVCDHSPSLTVARGLNRKRITRQMGEIAQINQQCQSFRVLAGIEVDILSDGRLDQDEDILTQLDLVVASVHTRFNQTQTEMTRRIIKAIENPLVHIIGHPTGRMIGKREPYAVDMDKVMDACRANDKVLELNASPDRLDLSDLNCRKAKRKGLKLAISSDAHTDRQLDQMAFGLATARRGWIEAADVVNTYPIAKLLKALHR